MTAPTSIMDSPLWVCAASDNPLITEYFLKGFDMFLHIDRYGGPFLTNNGLSLDKWYYAFADPSALPVSSPIARAVPPPPAAPSEGDAAGESKPFPYLCAVTFTVTREMCNAYDDQDGEGDKEELHMSTAAITLFTDMITSFHTHFALAPVNVGHVSLSIQTNQCHPLKMGHEYVAVAKVDKMGRRIVFNSIDYIDKHFTPEQAQAVQAAGLLNEDSDIADLRAVLPYCTVLANCKHVKSILSSDAQKKMVDKHAAPAPS